MDKIIYENWVSSVYIAKRNALGFAPHMHDEVEIVFIKNGPIKAYVDDSDYTLENDCCLVTFPNQLHSYRDLIPRSNIENYIMIFKSDILKSFSADFDKSIPENAVVTDKETLKKVECILEEAYIFNQKQSEYKIQALNAYATLVLQQLLPFFTFKKVRKLQKNISADIFTYCNQNYSEDISLDDIAREISISKEHIMRIFREKFHTNFRAYINHLRIEKAKKLLKTTDKSVTDISIEVGYNTIRTFNREFVLHVGLTPSEYRAKNQ